MADCASSLSRFLLAGYCGCWALNTSSPTKASTCGTMACIMTWSSATSLRQASRSRLSGRIVWRLPDWACLAISKALANLPEGTPVAEIRIEDADGASESFVLKAGADTAEGQWNATTSHPQPAKRQPWPREQAGWDYLTQLELSAPALPERLMVRSLLPTGTFVLRGITLLDDRTGAHAALTLPSDADFQRVHSGDVKIYRAMDTLPRAYLVGQATEVADDSGALAVLADAAFDPADRVVLLGPELAAAGLSNEVQAIKPAAANGRVSVDRFEPERVALQVDLPAPGVLVLSDSWYPGWQATVDGEPVPVLRANLLFRAVVLPAGVHDVVFEFKSASLRTGFMAALAAALVLLALLVFAWIRAKRG